MRKQMGFGNPKTSRNLFKTSCKVVVSDFHFCMIKLSNLTMQYFSSGLVQPPPRNPVLRKSAFGS